MNRRAFKVAETGLKYYFEDEAGPYIVEEKYQSR